jgi:RluA family pseudouridine synthase
LLKKYSLQIAPEQHGQRLDQVLAEWLPKALGQPVSKAKARKLIVAGAVYLNGSRVRIASKELIPGAKVDVQVDLHKLLETDGRAQDKPFEMSASRILYEDPYVIVVDKPPGLPTQPTMDEARDNLFASIKKFIAKRDGTVDPYVALHHRLDRDTSGVILFAKAKEANAGVAKMFAEHTAQKTYQALVAVGPGRKIPDAWVTKNFLGKIPGKGKAARYGAVRSGGDPAETRFKLIETWNGAAWVEAQPITGRTHQIRVHLAEGGLPILADVFYGGPRDAAPRQMLHAARLTFPHPIHQTIVTVQAPLPEDFQQCVTKLKRNP